MKEDEKYDLVVLLKIDKETVKNRIANRFSCKKCGAIYNKINKKTKIEGICDICGGKDFLSRVDDSELSSIEKRIEIFEKETKKVIEKESKKSDFLTLDASKTPEEIKMKINQFISEKLNV